MKPRRIRTPTVLQMEAVECGAAALAIVLAHFGRFVPLEVLRVDCGVSRDGSKASNVIKAARKYGLQAKGFKKEPAELPELEAPLIVFWNFHHFLVVEGWGDGIVYLNDPATGPRTVSTEEFDESFTGVVLVLRPGPEFVRGGERRGLVGSLRRRLPGARRALTYVVLAGLLLVGPGLVVPAFARTVVDQVLVGGATHWLKPLAVAMAATALVRGALTHLQTRYLGRLETKLTLAMSSKFLWHVLRLPVVFFHQRSAGDLAARVGANDRVARLLSGDLAANALNVVTVSFFAWLMAMYDPLLCALAVGIALANLGAMRWVARRRVDANQRMLQERAKLMGTATNGIMFIETLKASGAERDFFARWAGLQARVMNSEQRLQRPTLLLDAVPPLLIALNTAAVLGVGSLRIMSGQMSIGMLVAFQSLMASFLQPVGELVKLGSTLQEVEGDLNRLDDVLRYEEDPALGDPAADAPAPPRLEGRVELRDVTFGYSRLEPPVIEGFSLSVMPGQRVALVGASGSGKSTVGKLITGLFEPWEGEILFDGKPRKALPRRALHDSVALVDQDILLFEGSVRENLTLWDTTATEAAVLDAARDAAIHDDVAALVGGYDVTVEEGGRNFSGGQRQRLEIARALAGRPSVLILDEATSALDPLTELAVDRNLRRRGCTCVVIAHRLSTIRDCDEIVVLDRGRVVQRGTHEEMSTVAGPYATLIAAS